MWTDRQFWRDSTWRAFRTFCQTLAGLLTAYFSGMLAVVQTGQFEPQQVTSTGWPVWEALVYAAGVSSLISLLQSIDRERAVTSVAAQASPVTVVNNSAGGPAQ